MYTGLKHLHLLLIVLFVMSVLLKAILLLVNEERFDVYRKKIETDSVGTNLLISESGGYRLNLCD